MKACVQLGVFHGSLGGPDLLGKHRGQPKLGLEVVLLGFGHHAGSESIYLPNLLHRLPGPAC